MTARLFVAGILMVGTVDTRSQDLPRSDAAAGVSVPFDTTLVQSADVTGDGHPDTVRTRLTGKDFRHPFSWTCTVTSRGTSVYHAAGEDSRIDPFFADTNFVGRCSDYVSCKRAYYFGFFGFRLAPITREQARAMIWHLTEGNASGPFVRTLTDIHAMSRATADSLARMVVEQLRLGTCVLAVFNDSPVAGSPALVYVDAVETFVPVYAP